MAPRVWIEQTAVPQFEFQTAALPTVGVFRERWNPLHNKISRMARRRAQVAHFSTTESQNAKGEVLDVKLIPFMTMTGLLTSKAASPLTETQLRHRAEGFTRLSQRLNGFFLFLLVQRGNISAEQLQEPDPVRLLHR